LTDLGKIKLKLPNVTEAKELILNLSMTGSKVMNEWSFWIFPAKVDLTIPEGVMFADGWTTSVRQKLENGGKVLLTLDASSVVDPVPAHFWTVFWGRGLFPHILRPMGIYCDPAQPALPMGIYCDPAQPALAGFPTRDHSQFQWYSLMTDSVAMNLSKLPFDFEPVVYIIDDFNECTSLNLGKEGNRTPAQKQMLKSLLNYAGADNFKPAHTLTFEQLYVLVK